MSMGRTAKRSRSKLLITLAAVMLLWPHANGLQAADKQILTGPTTEKRFPPLTVPPGFKATLFGCDPLIEYPSVISLGPRAGTIFVAHDYTTGLGVEIVRRDEIRLVEDTDGDGYADKSTVYAGGFNSIQGLAYHAGTVYAMHAPLLTSLRDTDGDGKADERRDLLAGLGLPPEENSSRLHCANGVTVGHDGWLYLSLGDHGCDVKRPEGDRLLFQGGGILRCRFDGRDAHVFSTGLRNIYDVALDDELNVFVRDNENDGGDYMIRVCHSFWGADHGYPYLYYERPDEAMPPMADLGRGSSAGGVCYLETAFPPEFRGNLFFCEWGRSIVRYPRTRQHGGFAQTKEFEFAAGPATDTYGFKPTDAIVDRDGSLLISDWCDGQRPKRGRARVYRISYVGKKTGNAVNRSKRTQTKPNDSLTALVNQLGSESYHVRLSVQAAIERRGATGLQVIEQSLQADKLNAVARLHAIWIIALLGKQDSIDTLFQIAECDDAAQVRAQAVRALADLTDPILTKHRIDAGRGDVQIARRFAALAEKNDPRVVLEVVIALGRLRWPDAPQWIGRYLRNLDPAVAHAAMQTLRQCDNWSAVVKLLDRPASELADKKTVTSLVLRAMANQVDATIVDALIQRLESESHAERRQAYADVLTRVWQKPSPWEYWGYRPAPRPSNTVAWSRTAAIAAALDRSLNDPDRNLRAASLRRMQREKVPVKIKTLVAWLRQDRTANHVAAILNSLAPRPAGEVRSILENVVRDSRYPQENRLTALTGFAKGLDDANQPRLLELAKALNDDAVLAEVLHELSKHPRLASSQLMLAKLDSADAAVRAAAIDGLALRKNADAAKRLIPLLSDTDVRVRRAAAAAAGRLAVRASVVPLLKMAADSDFGVKRASLEALRLLGESAAVPQAVAALDSAETQLVALDYLADHAGPAQLAAVTATAARNRSTAVLIHAVRALAKWNSQRFDDPLTHRKLVQAIARIHGQSGVTLLWSASGPMTKSAATQHIAKLKQLKNGRVLTPPANWQSVFSTGTDSVVNPPVGKQQSKDTVWLAIAHVFADESANIQCLASSNGTLQVVLNGQSFFQRSKPGQFRADNDRFDAKLEKGWNVLAVKVGAVKLRPQFHLRFRRKSSKAEHEQLTQRALQSRGNTARGREVFLNAEKSLCIKCHRIGDQGAKIGPDLAGIGRRFSRIHLIEAILEPSRTVAPSYETHVIALTSGKSLNGVKVAETATTLTLGDSQGKTHVIQKSEIDERQTQARSTMPDGVEKRLTEREFIDLIAFLVSQKK